MRPSAGAEPDWRGFTDELIVHRLRFAGRPALSLEPAPGPRWHIDPSAPSLAAAETDAN